MRAEFDPKEVTRAILQITGRANQVFDAIRNMARHNGAMTLAEAGQRGLLPGRLQNTVPYTKGKFPEVKIEGWNDGN